MFAFFSSCSLFESFAVNMYGFADQIFKGSFRNFSHAQTFVLEDAALFR